MCVPSQNVWWWHDRRETSIARLSSGDIIKKESEQYVTQKCSKFNSIVVKVIYSKMNYQSYYSVGYGAIIVKIYLDTDHYEVC